MSRARPITLPDGEKIWFDTARNGEKAQAPHLELLAAVETDCDLDDLLDSVVTQGEVIKRLREALFGDLIPRAVLEKRQQWRRERQKQPECRICAKQGDSTKHHFVNKWILRELSSYQQKWADRARNCIPVCIKCHRDLHSRANGAHSIVDYLHDEERNFAERALSALSEERPKLLVLIARGDDSVYETRLVRDWLEGRFRVEEVEASTPATIRAAA